MAEKKHSVHVNVHYTVQHSKTRVRAYRDDTFIFSCFNDEDMKLYMRHIRQLIDAHRDIWIYVMRVTETTRRNRHGAIEFDKTRCRMFRPVGDGVVETKRWCDEEESYCLDSQFMTTKAAIGALEDEIRIHERWID